MEVDILKCDKRGDVAIAQYMAAGIRGNKANVKVDENLLSCLTLQKFKLYQTMTN